MNTLITAHAGAEGTQANSLDSLERLLRCGSDLVELDVRGRGDQLVLHHDRLAEGLAYPALAEALALLREVPGPRLNLDVKEAGLLPRAFLLAEKLGLEERLVFTGDVDGADRRWARERGVPLWLNYYLLPPLKWPRAHQQAARLGYAVLNIDQRRVSASMLQEAPEGLSIWTVDQEERLCALLEAGVHNITTRQPLLALRLRARIQQAR